MIGTERQGTASWVVLLVQLPGLPPKPAGILLVSANDQLHIALTDNVTADEDIKEIWDALGEDLVQRASEIGAARLLESLEQDLSLFLQIEGPRKHISTIHPEQTLQTLFQEHVKNVSTFC